MHNAHFLAGVILRFHFARIRQPGLLVDGKSVQLLALSEGEWGNAKPVFLFGGAVAPEDDRPKKLAEFLKLRGGG